MGNRSTEGSITRWIRGVKSGDEGAAAQLWDRYFEKIVQVARKRIASAPRRAAGEEDVAIDVFDTLCRNAARGRFPNVSDREALWKLLVVITCRKVSDEKRREYFAKKRGGRVTAPATDLAAFEHFEFESILSSEPSPALVAELEDECQWLLELLADDGLRTIARLSLEGLSAREIAASQSVSVRTIERKLAMIRTRWAEAYDR